MGQKAKTAANKGLHFCDCSAVGVKKISSGKWICQTCFDRQVYQIRTVRWNRPVRYTPDTYRCHAPGFSAMLVLFLMVLPCMAYEPITFQHVAAVVHVAGRPMVITQGITNFVADVPRKQFDRLNDVRKVQSKDVYSWKEFQNNPQINREYVWEYLRLLHSEIRTETGKAPTLEDVFACYRVGIGKLRSAGFDHAKIKDKVLAFEIRIFREFVRNPVLCEEPLPPLSVPRPQ